jgi:hypothetical protein
MLLKTEEDEVKKYFYDKAEMSLQDFVDKFNRNEFEVVI